MDIDLTILLQLGLFIAVLLSLNGILLRPVLKVIEARHQKIHGTRSEVDRLERLASSNMEAYQTRLREAREAAHKERDALRGAGRSEERRLLAEVRADIARIVNEARHDIGLAELEARKSLSADTQSLAKRLVEKAIGREVGP